MGDDPANNADEHAEEMAISLLKGAIGAVPIVGPFFNEVFFEIRNRIKQRRLEEFIQDLSRKLKNLPQSYISIEQLESEVFGDLLESVLRRVVQNRNHEKKKYYRNILLNGFSADYRPTDFTDQFLDILSLITSDELRLLNHYQEIKEVRGAIPGDVADDWPRGNPTELDYSDGDFETFARQLISRGFLSDNGIDKNRFGIQALQLIEVSKLGEQFIRFLKFSPPN